MLRNPQLFSRLQSVFGQVRVSNRGVPFIGNVTKDAVTGRGKITRVQAGEEYSVCCPFCGDTRFRLRINHMWGQELQGSRCWLFSCFNERCETDRKNRDKLYHMLTDGAAVPMTAVSKTVEPAAPTVGLSLPGNCILLNEMPKGHPAVRYMISRDYDPAVLGPVWNMCWCDYSLKQPPAHRLLCPIYTLDEATGNVIYGGSQARYYDIATGNDKPPDKLTPKWYTQPGTPKASILYNGWRAMKHPELVVIAEGPLDVFRIGPDHGVGLFGKNMSTKQAELLWKYFGSKGGDAILLLDPDALVPGKRQTESATDRALRLMNSMGTWHKIRVIRDLNGVDAGKHSTEEIWKLCLQALTSACYTGAD